MLQLLCLAPATRPTHPPGLLQWVYGGGCQVASERPVRPDEAVPAGKKYLGIRAVHRDFD
jgi:hypothetical protein